MGGCVRFCTHRDEAVQGHGDVELLELRGSLAPSFANAIDEALLIARAQGLLSNLPTAHRKTTRG